MLSYISSQSHKMFSGLWGKQPMLENQVPNQGGGSSFQVCDMQRLQRFIVLGSESNTYYSTAPQILMNNVQCVSRLLQNNHYKEVLDLIEKYSKEGRVPKEDPILIILAICAEHEDEVIRKAAYQKVNSICNIPTKLFRFLQLTHDEIVRKRIANPPEPQPGNKRKRVSKQLSKLNICEEVKKEPVESIDDSGLPPKKKKKPTPEFKKVNKAARKSLGWGRMRRNGIASFYVDGEKDACRLLYLITKYKQRCNWSHKQVLGYAHPKMNGDQRDAKNLVLKYCRHGYDKIAKEMKEMAGKPGVSENISEAVAYIEVINEVNSLSPDKEGDEEKLIDLLTKYGIRPQAKEFITAFTLDSVTKENIEGRKSPIQIVREHIPTGFLKSQKVWEALLVDMPMTALIRNLGKMSSLNMFVNNTKNTALVINALKNEKRLQSARVHPMKILIALQIYEKGAGDKGSLTWNVNTDIVEALNAAFYKSFRTPEIGKNFKTDKKYMLALDVSGSMSFSGCSGCPLITPAMASIAMAMVTWNIEDDVDIMAFGGTFQDMKPYLKKEMTIGEAMHAGSSINMGCTDCSLPMVYAQQGKKEVDVFIVYTDSETNSGRMQPMTALRMYNQEMKREAKLIVCAMQSDGFTIADPNDSIALDIVGFDTNVPEIISNFAKGGTNMKCDVCKGCKEVQQE